ncbi:hypothetical protein SDC9_100979 [bioreactor metagenome]|uniref:Uncharacterized protein n=1 Tax=bioreactor metagenome TaxID=1076179 RepID=A0A645ALT8_9ZZZZ
MEGGALDLLPRGADGVKIHLIGHCGFGVQLAGGAQDIHGGSHAPSRDVAVVNGQNGMIEHSHVVNQRLTGGSEHLGDPARCAVQKFKGFLTGHIRIPPTLNILSLRPSKYKGRAGKKRPVREGRSSMFLRKIIFLFSLGDKVISTLRPLRK